MPFPYPNSKENTLVTERQENSVLLQLWLQVAISDKHRNTEGSLVPSETSLRDVFVAIFSYKNKKQSLTEGLLHNPHKKQKHFSITAESCWRWPTICSPKTTHSRDTYTCSLLQELAKQKGFVFITIILVQDISHYAERHRHTPHACSNTN